LGWPEKTADFEKYYPTSLLITGYDILFFWVARMAMLGIHFTKKVPFRAVYLHSLVRTGSGEKMSKSKGTGLDPVVLNQQYGTDAMRFCLASMAAPGTDIVLSDDRLGSARNFANKIWNAARFLFVNLEKFEQGGTGIAELAAPEVRAMAPYAYAGSVPLVDQWLYTRLSITIEAVNEALKNYRFHEAAQSVYQFFWGDFCDWYIEWVKPELQSADRERAVVAWKNLFAAFEAALRLLHPVMPFLTEELWHQLPQAVGAKSIALGAYPEGRTEWKNADAHDEFEILIRIVTAAREMRADGKVPTKKAVSLEISPATESVQKVIVGDLTNVLRLATLSRIDLAIGRLSGTGIIRSTKYGELRIPFEDIADATARDPENERVRLKKEIEGLQKAVSSKESQLGNGTFRNRAPAKIIQGLEATLAEQRVELKKLEDRLGQL
jgi:valyl-tRNA synthetase